MHGLSSKLERTINTLEVKGFHSPKTYTKSLAKKSEGHKVDIESENA